MKEIFFYLTFVCNMRCRHCYVGENLDRDTYADPDQVFDTLARCRQKGARQVTFLGGEPTLHPRYEQILAAAAELEYETITVDTNGTARSPIPRDSRPSERLAVRFSFDGADAASHDAIRGPGAFKRSLACFQETLAAGVRTEVTLTLNALNVSQIEPMVERFAQASEVNFHFVSMMGSALQHAHLALTAEEVLRAQAQLEVLQAQSTAHLRYPWLLVRREELADEIERGCGCHMWGDQRMLILPRGETCRCPLQIQPGDALPLEIEQTGPYAGCPLGDRLLPQGIPEGYALTCISWKDHERARPERD